MKCIIVDDEPIARIGLKRLIAGRPELELFTSLQSAEGLTEFIHAHGIELVFLDIEMPGVNGIEAAAKFPSSCMTIFSTAYEKYALESYEVNAIDYLVKPITTERFNRAIDKALEIKKRNERADAALTANSDAGIVVRSEGRFVRLHYSDILFIEASKDYLIFHLPDKRVISRMTVKSLEAQLPEKHFLRINKSHIVNVDRLESFDSNDVFINNKTLSIGISYRDSVKRRLLIM